MKDDVLALVFLVRAQTQMCFECKADEATRLRL